jgi:hypothetical protein
MNKITVLLSFFIILITGVLNFYPTNLYAAFPMSNRQVEQMEKNEAKIKAHKKNSVLQRKVTAATTDGEDNGIYGILALSMGVVGWATAGFGIGFLLLLGALITGIIGVNHKKKYKGMALAGLILGAAGVLIFLFVVLIFAAWVL